jgi:uncharacterized damage-inducible protein DinB
MRLADTILTELDAEAKSTARILERVPADKYDWAPHPKSTPLGKLANHLATLPAGITRLLSEGKFDVSVARPPAFDGSEAPVDVYKRNVARLKEALAPMDDAALAETFSMVNGEKVVMSMPKIAMLRTMFLNHTYHHRGQLTVYLRLLDIPLPSIYGPTADENPFA